MPVGDKPGKGRERRPAGPGAKGKGRGPVRDRREPAPARPRTGAGAPLPLDPKTLARLEEAGLLDARAVARASRAPGNRERRGPVKQQQPAQGRRGPAPAAGGPARGPESRRSMPVVRRADAAPEAKGREERPARRVVGRPGKVVRPEPAGPQRLQKVLAHAGVASRRAAEELILAGRVRVNGEVVTTLGTKVTPGVDRVEVDGKALGQREELAYCLLNKPRGVMTTVYDPQGRKTVLDLIPDAPVRLFPVGRLDYDTEGLLLLTNDGELAHSLMHPAKQVWKTYVARLRGVPSAAKLRELEKGIELEDGRTAPCRTRLLKVTRERQNPRNQVAWVEISLHEGRNRQVRRMFEAIGHEVIGLSRTTLGPLSLRGLQPGQYRYLDLREIKALRHGAGLKSDPPHSLAEVPTGVRGELPQKPEETTRPAAQGRPAQGRPAALPGPVRRFRAAGRITGPRPR